VPLELRVLLGELAPEFEDHVFVVEVEQWVSQHGRERKRKDPNQPARGLALSRMVARVCRRAGIRPLTPHQLRHGFANRFLHESGRALLALALMGHSRPDTTQAYTDEVDPDDLAAALARAPYNRYARESPGRATDQSPNPDEAQTLEWRRRVRHGRRSAPPPAQAWYLRPECDLPGGRRSPISRPAGRSAALQRALVHVVGGARSRLASPHHFPRTERNPHATSRRHPRCRGRAALAEW